MGQKERKVMSVWTVTWGSSLKCEYLADARLQDCTCICTCVYTTYKEHNMYLLLAFVCLLVFELIAQMCIFGRGKALQHVLVLHFFCAQQDYNLLTKCYVRHNNATQGLYVTKNAGPT